MALQDQATALAQNAETQASRLIVPLQKRIAELEKQLSYQKVTKGTSTDVVIKALDIDISEYEKLANEFNPIKFDASKWVKIAKDAGMKYLNEGDKLEFTLEDGPKGPSAVNLKKVD